MGADTNDMVKQSYVSNLVVALQATNAGIFLYMHNEWGEPGVTLTAEWTNGYQPWIGQTMNAWQMDQPQDGDIYDQSTWPSTIHWLDMATQTTAQFCCGHTPSMIPITLASLLTNVYVPFEGPLIVSVQALWQSPLVYDRNLVESARQYISIGYPPVNPDYQTNVWMLGIDQDATFQPPMKIATNGTVEIWTKNLGANPPIGNVPAGSLWGDGSIAVMVINRGYSTNVTATSITINPADLGGPAGMPVNLHDVWQYTNMTVSSAATVTFNAPTNSCSLWMLGDPQSVNTVVPVAIQLSGSNVLLNWSEGTLMESTNVNGPWVTNSAAPPYAVSPTQPQMFYRVQP